jgi:hypothetical protein
MRSADGPIPLWFPPLPSLHLHVAGSCRYKSNALGDTASGGGLKGSRPSKLPRSTGIRVTRLGLQPDCGPARDGVDRTLRVADDDFNQAPNARVRHAQAEAPPLDRNLRGTSMESGHGASTLRPRRSVGMAQVIVRRGVVVARRPVDLVGTRTTATRRVDSQLSPDAHRTVTIGGSQNRPPRER